MKQPDALLFFLFNSETQRFEKRHQLTATDAAKANKRFKKWGLPTRWMQPVFPDLGGRHVAQWRSICETFPSPQHPKGKEPHCTCGKQYDDAVHFRTDELERLSPEAQMVAFGDL